MTTLPPKLGKAHLDEATQGLVKQAKELYQKELLPFCANHKPPAYVCQAPGRVNLIGEHVDYTGGVVLPMAIQYSTVVYGTGFLHTGKGTGATSVRLRLVTDAAVDNNNNNSSDGANIIVQERRLVGDYKPPSEGTAETTWVDYVVGVVAQYLRDLPKEGCVLDLAMAFSSNLPLGSGLSSSASLEVAVATLLECYLKDMCYSTSITDSSGVVEDTINEKALRCQRAEHEWAFSPCGIMDQLVCSGAQEGALLLIDCRDLTRTSIVMKNDPENDPVVVITNSGVQHSIAAGEYGERRHQCDVALEALQEVPLYHVTTLRDANKKDVDAARDKMDDTIYKRVSHVVSENVRTLECKVALKMGIWDRVGELMNASHDSLRDDFEVSCEEVDFLVETARATEGVYGSRMTGGGFGGCTVTLVPRRYVEALKENLVSKYQEKYDQTPDVFVTEPASGARVLAIDMDYKSK